MQFKFYYNLMVITGILMEVMQCYLKNGCITHHIRITEVSRRWKFCLIDAHCSLNGCIDIDLIFYRLQNLSLYFLIWYESKFWSSMIKIVQLTGKIKGLMLYKYVTCLSSSNLFCYMKFISRLYIVFDLFLKSNKFDRCIY